jgi:hypothetical protein
MKYFKITCSNGYCGCDEEWFEEAEDTATADDFNCEDYLQNYGFYDPDARFIDPDDFETEEEYEEAYADYQANISIDVEEITREEYDRLYERI